MKGHDADPGGLTGCDGVVLRAFQGEVDRQGKPEPMESFRTV